jgi:5'-nucleotidase
MTYRVYSDRRASLRQFVARRFRGRESRQIRAVRSMSFTAHAGDVIGASPIVSTLFRHEPTVEALNLIGFDVGAVGNHEFDAGFTELQRIINGGCHPDDGCFLDEPYQGTDPALFLGANVVDEDTGTALLQPYHIERVQGVQVGFLGLTLEGTGGIVAPSGIEGIAFEDEVTTINRYVDELRSRPQPVEAIVVLLHEGGFAGGGANDCDGGLQGRVAAIVDGLHDAVDVVVSGHTHQAYVCDIDGTLVTQAGDTGRWVTEINLRIDRRTKDVQVATAINHAVDHSIAAEPQVAALVDRYAKAADELAAREVGRISADLRRGPLTDAGESPMGNVIADAMLEATVDDGDAQVAIHNDGGVRADIVFERSDGLPDGTVTYGDVFTVQPFGNSLVTMTLTGDQLLAALDQQWQPDQERYRPLHISDGLSITWTSTGPAVWEGEIVDVALDGEPIDPAAEYRVATNSFLADGGSFFSAFTDGTDRLVGVMDVDALEAYFLARDIVDPPALDRKKLQ